MYYRVIPFKRTFDTYGLVYFVSESLKDSLQAGNIVLVPFRNTQELALCMGEVGESQLNCKAKDIKEIISLQSEFVFLSLGQRELVDFISQHYITPIHHALGLYFPRNLLEKIAKNTIDKIKISEYSYLTPEIILSQEQEVLYQKICSSLQRKHLIYGVTGSGKTQIYMKIISDNLISGKQTLLLIPEIILTSQIGQRVKQEFGEDVIILHSGVTAAKKAKYWMDIHSGNAKIIIGTRSSLFYPYNNLGAIIIDEEHDSSYISDQAPRYHTLDIAEKISNLSELPLVLGSGTPRATSFYKALNGDFDLHQLLEKYEKKNIEEVREDSTSELKYKGKYSVESNRLKDYDYSSQGMYFITICTKDKQCFFGEIINGEMIFNENGVVVKNIISNINKQFDFIENINHIVMPNHIHVVLKIVETQFIASEENKHEKQDIGNKKQDAGFNEQDAGFNEQDAMNRISTKQGGVTGEKNCMLKNGIGKAIRGFKGKCTYEIRKIQQTNELHFAWQANYHDHIIKNEEEYLNIKNYIQNNPKNWNEDEENIHNEM